MLMFIFKDKEDVIQSIHNGFMQQNIYDYFNELKENNDLLFPDICNNDFEKESICDYFEAQIGEEYIGWEHILDPSSAMEHLIHNIIISVFDRWKKENEK